MTVLKMSEDSCVSVERPSGTISQPMEIVCRDRGTEADRIRKRGEGGEGKHLYVNVSIQTRISLFTGRSSSQTQTPLCLCQYPIIFTMESPIPGLRLLQSLPKFFLQCKVDSGFLLLKRWFTNLDTQ